MEWPRGILVCEYTFMFLTFVWKYRQCDCVRGVWFRTVIHHHSDDDWFYVQKFVVYSPCWPPTTGTSRHIGLAVPVRAVHVSSFFIHLRWFETILRESMQERSLYLLVLLLKCTTILSFTKHYGTPLSIWTSIIWIRQLHHKSNYGAPKWILGLHNLRLYFANTDKSIVFTCPSA